MAIIKRLLLFSVLAAVASIAAVPFVLNGYEVANYLNTYLARFCDVSRPVENTENLEWARILRGNWSEIYQEFLAFERKHSGIPRVSEVSEVQYYLDKQPEHAWRSLLVRLYGHDSQHIRHFPKLQAALAYAPKVYTAMFSIIEPHYIGGGHNGIYRGTLRYLLGLEVRGAVCHCVMCLL